MYVVREIFYLQFGRFKEAKAMFEQANSLGLMKMPEGGRILTDFTGESYRFIFESPYKTLADFEADLNREMSAEAWKEWYEKFKPLVRHSEREILKQIS
ncbi:hypothetical protein FEDK69T_00270 [Flavobacterium enshiense DK69]|uniref:NIPSNAP domain-containing protein n=1 Tax=Flavobacterium enshiense DK69 TaxID=1107311 RepID=V6SG83_9FLAO|nr:hypothetical protein [Flavobacterium enshiense]ESU25262.1 hypothetical protein FEDK69T_00270 [Flavobacterium enshiense DK69]KGO93167.1 hypothetical protein Q767_15010 [Flavobacterium enshiense DK69]